MQGYRWMHATCLKNGINAKKEGDCINLSSLDPISSAMCRLDTKPQTVYCLRASNIWQVDSYNKLRSYGLCINGCIYGLFSK